MAIWDRTLESEGGYVDNPNDPGGATNFGISSRYLKQKYNRDVSPEEIQNLTREDAVKIYEEDFYKKPNIDKLPTAIQENVFDMAVNSGDSQAIKLLQRDLNVTADGIIGPSTIAAAKKAIEEGTYDASNYSDSRKKYYEGLVAADSRREEFRKGWLARADKFAIGPPIGPQVADVRPQTTERTSFEDIASKIGGFFVPSAQASELDPTTNINNLTGLEVYNDAVPRDVGMSAAETLINRPITDPNIEVDPTYVDPIDSGGELISRSIQSGSEGLAADFDRLGAIINSIMGDEKGVKLNLERARVREEAQGRLLQGATTFEELVMDPEVRTLENFMNVGLKLFGSAIPYGVSSIAAWMAPIALASFAPAALASAGLATATGKALLTKTLRDALTKKYIRKEVLDKDEEELLNGLWNLKKYGSKEQLKETGKKWGGRSAFGVAFPTGASMAQREYEEAGFELTPDIALKSLGLGIPIAAVDRISEGFIRDVVLKNVGKNALKSTKNIPDSSPLKQYAKNVAKSGAKGFGYESVAESAQEGITVAQRFAIDPTYTAEEAYLRLAEAFVGGGIAGKAFGAGGTAIASAPALAMEMLLNTQQSREKAKLNAAQSGFDDATAWYNASKNKPIREDSSSLGKQIDLTAQTNPATGKPLKSATWIPHEESIDDIFKRSAFKKTIKGMEEGEVKKLGKGKKGRSSLFVGKVSKNASTARGVQEGYIFSQDEDLASQVVGNGATRQTLKEALGYASADIENPIGAIQVKIDGDVVWEQVVNEETKAAARSAATEFQLNLPSGTDVDINFIDLIDYKGLREGFGDAVDDSLPGDEPGDPKFIFDDKPENLPKNVNLLKTIVRHLNNNEFERADNLINIAKQQGARIDEPVYRNLKKLRENDVRIPYVDPITNTKSELYSVLGQYNTLVDEPVDKSPFIETLANQGRIKRKRGESKRQFNKRVSERIDSMLEAATIEQLARIAAEEFDIRLESPTKEELENAIKENLVSNQAINQILQQAIKEEDKGGFQGDTITQEAVGQEVVNQQTAVLETLEENNLGNPDEKVDPDDEFGERLALTLGIFEQDNSTKKGSPYEARLIEYSIGNDISRQTPSGIQWENKPFDKRYDDTRALLSRFRNMAQPELPALDFLPNGLPLTNDFVGDLDTLAKTETGKFRNLSNSALNGLYWTLKRRIEIKEIDRIPTLKKIGNKIYLVTNPVSVPAGQPLTAENLYELPSKRLKRDKKTGKIISKSKFDSILVDKDTFINESITVLLDAEHIEYAKKSKSPIALNVIDPKLANASFYSKGVLSGSPKKRKQQLLETKNIPIELRQLAIMGMAINKIEALNIPIGEPPSRTQLYKYGLIQGLAELRKRGLSVDIRLPDGEVQPINLDPEFKWIDKYAKESLKAVKPSKIILNINRNVDGFIPDKVIFEYGKGLKKFIGSGLNIEAANKKDKDSAIENSDAVILFSDNLESRTSDILINAVNDFRYKRKDGSIIPNKRKPLLINPSPQTLTTFLILNKSKNLYITEDFSSSQFFRDDLVEAAAKVKDTVMATVLSHNIEDGKSVWLNPLDPTPNYLKREEAPFPGVRSRFAGRRNNIGPDGKQIDRIMTAYEAQSTLKTVFGPSSEMKTTADKLNRARSELVSLYGGESSPLNAPLSFKFNLKKGIHEPDILLKHVLNVKDVYPKSKDESAKARQSILNREILNGRDATGFRADQTNFGNGVYSTQDKIFEVIKIDNETKKVIDTPDFNKKFWRKFDKEFEQIRKEKKLLDLSQKEKYLREAVNNINKKLSKNVSEKYTYGLRQHVFTHKAYRQQEKVAELLSNVNGLFSEIKTKMSNAEFQRQILSQSPLTIKKERKAFIYTVPYEKNEALWKGEIEKYKKGKLDESKRKQIETNTKYIPYIGKKPMSKALRDYVSTMEEVYELEMLSGMAYQQDLVGGRHLQSVTSEDGRATLKNDPGVFADDPVTNQDAGVISSYKARVQGNIDLESGISRIIAEDIRSNYGYYEAGSFTTAQNPAVFDSMQELEQAAKKIKESSLGVNFNSINLNNLTKQIVSSKTVKSILNLSKPLHILSAKELAENVDNHADLIGLKDSLDVKNHRRELVNQKITEYETERNNALEEAKYWKDEASIGAVSFWNAKISNLIFRDLKRKATQLDNIVKVLKQYENPSQFLRRGDIIKNASIEDSVIIRSELNALEASVTEFILKQTRRPFFTAIDTINSGVAKGAYIRGTNAHIVVIDDTLGDNDKLSVLLHELGHVLFVEQYRKLLTGRTKPEETDLYKDYLAWLTNNRKNIPTQYVLENGAASKSGFEEWYADQAAAAFLSKLKGVNKPKLDYYSRGKVEGSPVSNLTKIYFNKVALKLRQLFDFVLKQTKLGNIGTKFQRISEKNLTKAYEVYIDGVIESNRQANSDLFTSTDGNYMSTGESLEVKFYVEKFKKHLPPDLIKNVQGAVAKVSRSPAIPIISKHFINLFGAATHKFEQFGEPGKQFARFWQNKSASYETTGFHTAKKLMNNELFSMLEDIVGVELKRSDIWDKEEIKPIFEAAEDGDNFSTEMLGKIIENKKDDEIVTVKVKDLSDNKKSTTYKVEYLRKAYEIRNFLEYIRVGYANKTFHAIAKPNLSIQKLDNYYSRQMDFYSIETDVTKQAALIDLVTKYVTIRFDIDGNPIPADKNPRLLTRPEAEALVTLMLENSAEHSDVASDTKVEDQDISDNLKDILKEVIGPDSLKVEGQRETLPDNPTYKQVEDNLKGPDIKFSTQKPFTSPGTPAALKRSLRQIPTRALREKNLIVTPQQAIVQYIHHMTRKVEFEKRGGSEHLNSLVNDILKNKYAVELEEIKTSYDELLKQQIKENPNIPKEKIQEARRIIKNRIRVLVEHTNYIQGGRRGQFEIGQVFTNQNDPAFNYYWNTDAYNYILDIDDKLGQKVRKRPNSIFLDTDLALNEKIDNLSNAILEDKKEWTNDVDGQLGRRGTGMSSWVRTFNSVAAVHTIMTTLLFTTITSFTDLSGIAARSKELGLFGKGVSNIMKDLNYTEMYNLSRSVGTVTSDGLDNLFISVGELDFANKWARSGLEWWFRTTFLTQWTKITRVLATAMGREFVINTANEVNSNIGDVERKKRYLKELGLTAEEVAQWQKQGQHFEGEVGVKVKNAIARFSEESIIRPNPAQRPSWANNPYLQIFFQLKSYFYGYGMTVLGGLGREITNRYREDGNFAGGGIMLLFAGGFMMALSALALEIRELVKWLFQAFFGFITPEFVGVEATGRTFRSNYLSPPAYLWEIFERSGAVGPWSIGVTAGESLKWDSNPLFASVPIFDAVDDVFRKGEWQRTVPLLNNIVPYTNR